MKLVIMGLKAMWNRIDFPVYYMKDDCVFVKQIMSLGWDKLM